MYESLHCWDSLEIVALYARYRQEVDNNYPTHGKYDEGVFEISYLDGSNQTVPRIRSTLEIMDSYFFEGIVTEINIEIVENSSGIETSLSFTEKDLPALEMQKIDNGWSSRRSIVDHKRYPEGEYYMMFSVRVNEEKLKAKLQKVLNLWIQREYSFFPYKNTLRINIELEITINYILTKLDRYDPNRLYISIAEIYGLVPEMATRTSIDENGEEYKEEYEKYDYINNEENFDAICALYFLDSIGCICIDSGFFGFHKDNQVCFRITVFTKFYELFYNSAGLQESIYSILEKEGISNRTLYKKPLLIPEVLIPDRYHIQYDEVNGYLIIHGRSKKLIQKQKIFIDGLFDLQSKFRDGWVPLEELAIYDDHIFNTKSEQEKEKIIKNFYNIGNHLSKTIKLETGAERVLEINIKSVRLNPQYTS